MSYKLIAMQTDLTISYQHQSLSLHSYPTKNRPTLLFEIYVYTCTGEKETV